MNAIAPIQQFQQEIQSQKAGLQSILPDHLTVERFIKTAMIAIQSNPDLLNADRQSLFTSLQRCAGDGLVPDNREAALVEFNTNIGTRDKPSWVKKVQYMPMVDGVLKRARQSGEVAVITARAVHQNDAFDYWVDEHGEHLKHRPLFSGDRGPMVLVYAMAKMKSGDVIVEPMTMADVEKVRSASKTGAYGPWKDWFERMALKSALHRLARRLPNSSEVMEMLGNDNWMYDFSNRKERDISPSKPDQRPSLPEYPQERLEKKLSDFRASVDGGTDPQDIIGFLESKYTLTESQRQQILGLKQGAEA